MVRSRLEAVLSTCARYFRRSSRASEGIPADVPFVTALRGETADNAFMQSSLAEPLLRDVKRIAADVAAAHAEAVDASARFPHETFAALREARVLAAAVPRAAGGGGLTLAEQAACCAALATGCSASAMVLAMHWIEVACLARHGSPSAWFRTALEEIAAEQTLIASVTSEVGTSGDTRSSVCAVEVEGERFRLSKAATTVSYGAHADALLVTARRAPHAPPGDQVLVYLRRSDYVLTPTSVWNPLGMRGTCSPGGQLEATGAVAQIVPGAFAESSARTMVPYSHVLWSALWSGIAADALARAAACVRAQARRSPGKLPPAATLLSNAYGELETMRQATSAVADAVDAMGTAVEPLDAMGWALKLNHLKVRSAEAAPRIVQQALRIIGVAGYRNDGPHAVGRHLRDSLSAALMVSNDRITAQNAAMLMVVKDV